MTWQLSILRLVLDPGGSDEITILDWGDETMPFALPWRQVVETVPTIEGGYAGQHARGGVARDLTISQRVSFASFEAMLAAQLGLDATLEKALLKSLTLDFRTTAPPDPDPTPAIGSGDETTATEARWTATAVLESCDQEPVGNSSPALVRVWRLRLGKLNTATP